MLDGFVGCAVERRRWWVGFVRSWGRVRCAFDLFTKGCCEGQPLRRETFPGQGSAVQCTCTLNAAEQV